LALGTEPPSEELLGRRPYSSTASLISRRMWRHISVQAAYQLAMLLTLLTVGDSIFGITPEFLAAK
jgi:Ca2+-transporting ATPase